MRTLKIGSLVAVMSLGQLAHAQLDTVQLQDVTIVSNRLQHTVRSLNLSSSVLTKNQIQRLSGSVPADWLGTISGVDIRQRGPIGVQTDMSIRGGSFDQSLVMLNGLKLNDPQTGHHMFNLPITTEAIAQIDIVKTAASRLYGINALTGAVNFVTKVPIQNQVYLQGFGGDFGLYGVQVGAAYTNKKVATHLSYGKTHSNGYSRNTDFTIHNLFLQQTITRKKSTMDVIGGYTDRRFGATGFYVLNSNEFESVQTAFGGLIHEVKWGQLSIKSQAYYRYNQDHYVYIRSNPKVYQNFHYSTVAGAEIHATYKSSVGESGVGIDTRKENLDSKTLGYRNRTILGAFAEHRFKFKQNRISFTPGIYLNYITNAEVSVFPGVDAGFAVTRKMQLKGSISKGMRLPTYTDLYYKGPSNVGNPNLKIEEAISSEVGVSYYEKKWQASITVFNRNSKNLIDWAKTVDSLPWQPQNVNQVVFRGFESNVTYKLNNLIEQLNLGYTFIDANIKQVEGYKSTYALTNLRHQVTGTVYITWYKKLTQTFTVRHINRVTLPDYTLVDSKLSYAFKYGRVYTEITNLFNVRYKEAGFVTMPGRWFRVGIDLKLNFK